jgi:hypothetical protein
MATLRKGAPAKNMFGSIRGCDAVIDYRPCSKRATFTLIPDRIPGVYSYNSYWCIAHAYEKIAREWPVVTVPERQY